MKKEISETITENIFREFYGSTTFTEKSAIPKSCGFVSKKGTSHIGYPDFYLERNDYFIIVEAKPIKHSRAEDEVKFYMLNNTLQKNKHVLGIAISGQDDSQIKATYFIKRDETVKKLDIAETLMPLLQLDKKYGKYIAGETISDAELVKVLKDLNEKFHDGNKVRDTERSLFFSGLLIALTNDNFRNTYQGTSSPTKLALATTKATVLEAHNLNKAIIEAIDEQIKIKVNNLSKEFSWKDRFSFIKNIDYSLTEYKEIIALIESKIYRPYQNEEKYDILGKAYKIFLSRAGSTDNKNIILTPDHIKTLMIKLARLTLSDVIIDTCTGSGGFLMEAMERLISMAKGDSSKVEHIQTNQLIGFEIDSVLFALACSNMFLHGDGRTNMLFRSSLLNQNEEAIVNSNDTELFNYIKSLSPTKCIINPPYEDNNSIKFALQAINYLQSNGKLIIIMPTPTLTKNAKIGGLTEKLLSIAKLDFVIKMPDKLFSEQKRSVNTSIFGFTKTPHHHDDEVLFCRVTDDGYVSIQHKGRVDVNNKWSDIENELINNITNFREKGFEYQKRKIYSESVLIPYGVKKQKTSNHLLYKIGTMFDLSTKGDIASESLTDENIGEYDLITASSEWKKINTFKHDKEAIVFAINAGGSLGKSQYVNGKFTQSNLCIVLTPKREFVKEHPISLRFYNEYFESIKENLVADLADGTSKLSINAKTLAEYFIEYIPYEVQQAFVNSNLVTLDKKKTELSKIQNQVKAELTAIIAGKNS